MLVTDGCCRERWVALRCKNRERARERKKRIRGEEDRGRQGEGERKSGFFYPSQYWQCAFVFTHPCPSSLSREALLCPHLEALSSVKLKHGAFYDWKQWPPPPIWLHFSKIQTASAPYPTCSPTLMSPPQCHFQRLLQCSWQTSIVATSFSMTQQSSQVHEQFSKYLWSWEMTIRGMNLSKCPWARLAATHATDPPFLLLAVLGWQRPCFLPFYRSFGSGLEVGVLK